MIAATGLRWILTLAFVAVALYGIWRASTPTPAAARVTHLLHALMALAMVAMAWPWGMGLAAVPQIWFFGLAAAWLAAAAVLWPGTRKRAHAVRAAVPHVLMMAAMAWMLAAMDTAMPGGTGGAPAMADMPGMDMSGAGATSAMTLTGAGPRWTAGLLAAVFLALALWWLARGFDRARGAAPAAAGHVPATAGHHPWDMGCHGVMALGMSVMFVLLV